MYKFAVLFVGLLAASLVQCQSSSQGSAAAQAGASTETNSINQLPSTTTTYVASSTVQPAPVGIATPAVGAGVAAVPAVVPVGVPAGFPAGFPAGYPAAGLGGLGLAGLPLGGLSGSFAAGLPFLGGVGGDASFLGGAGAPFLGGLTGTSYAPSTWLGSALGAKGDILFPIVLFVFFIVGVWTVINFLLAVLVPLIAAKFTKIGAVEGAKGLGAGFGEINKFVRSADPSDLGSPGHMTDAQVAEMSRKIAECIASGEIKFSAPAAAVNATQVPQPVAKNQIRGTYS